ncbi:hypothetical protein [Methanomethylophilus alvi]|uniref:hypothetical protein n=1 Tax=Methanomethylophilus alvi TaxID=1291540 RepID=UPI0037DDA39D
MPELCKANIYKVSYNSSYWKASNYSPIKNALTLKYLRERGMYYLLDNVEKVKERCFNRRVPNGTHGGVRGQTGA